MKKLAVGKLVIGLLIIGALAMVPRQGQAQGNSASSCGDLPNHNALSAALATANAAVNLVLNNEMWGTIVSADGTVCAVAHTGDDVLQSQWLASRVISAQKANTANSLSLGNNDGGVNAGLALSTANLWAATQPGGSLWELTQSNPVDTEVAYSGSSSKFGTSGDPMVGKRIGGNNVFGGGLALYNSVGDRIGGIGVSGDTSCRDHMAAWETRAELELDFVTAGVSGDATRPDNIVFDVADDGHGNPESAGGFGHPHCLDTVANENAAAAALTQVPAL